MSVDSAGLEGNGNSYGPALSADGHFAAFSSAASNLVAGDGNGTYDIFVRDLQAGVTTCISVNAAGTTGNGTCLLTLASLSDDARYVVFLSDASDLIANDTNGVRDVFVRDRQLGQTKRVSVSSFGAEGNDSATLAAISAGGRYVVFTSNATNMVSGDTNGKADVFVRDRQTSQTSLASPGLASAQSNDDSFGTAISDDGRYVLLSSFANNLVAGDTNALVDTFVYDRQAAQMTRVSVDSSGLEANGLSFGTTMTPDGRYVALQSYASNLVVGDTNGQPDAFVHDRLSGQTTRVSIDSSGSQANADSGPTRMSADGRFVVFYSSASNVVAGDTNAVDDVFVRDRVLNHTERISVDSTGSQANASSANGFISADGHWIGFASNASNLVAGDTNGVSDAFLREFHPPCGALNYCTGGTTSNGCVATMSANGTPSASALSGFTLTIGNLDGQRNGLIFYGVSGTTALPWSSTSTSFMCVKPPTQRTFTQSSGGSLGQCNGHISLDWNAFTASYSGALGAPFHAGDIVCAQGWFRDPPAPKTSNLSDALEFVVCP